MPPPAGLAHGRVEHAQRRARRRHHSIDAESGASTSPLAATDDSANAIRPRRSVRGGSGEVRLQGRLVQGSAQPASGRARADLEPVPDAAARRILLRLGGRRRPTSTATACSTWWPGRIYYLGPALHVAPRDLRRRQRCNPSDQFPRSGMVDFAFDFTGDGWPDVVAGENRAAASLREPERRAPALGEVPRPCRRAPASWWS